MTEWHSERVERLAEQIVGYLAGNPHAADTAAGIRNWWLSGISHLVSHGDVERAIFVLLERGLLECRTLADGTQIYARAPSGVRPNTPD